MIRVPVYCGGLVNSDIKIMLVDACMKKFFPENSISTCKMRHTSEHCKGRFQHMRAKKKSKIPTQKRILRWCTGWLVHLLVTLSSWHKDYLKMQESYQMGSWSHWSALISWAVEPISRFLANSITVGSTHTHTAYPTSLYYAARSIMKSENGLWLWFVCHNQDLSVLQYMLEALWEL